MMAPRRSCPAGVPYVPYAPYVPFVPYVPCVAPMAGRSERQGPWGEREPHASEGRAIRQACMARGRAPQAAQPCTSRMRAMGKRRAINGPAMGRQCSRRWARHMGKHGQGAWASSGQGTWAMGKQCGRAIGKQWARHMGIGHMGKHCGKHRAGGAWVLSEQCRQAAGRAHGSGRAACRRA